jgi:hypothetical protein
MLSFLLALYIYFIHIIIHFISSHIISFSVRHLVCFMRKLPLPLPSAFTDSRMLPLQHRKLSVSADSTSTAPQDLRFDWPKEHENVVTENVQLRGSVKCHRIFGVSGHPCHQQLLLPWHHDKFTAAISGARYSCLNS